MSIEKKRKRSHKEETTKPIKAKPAAAKTEEAFPRGGGSVLTPLEYREAAHEAKAELFEEATTGESAPKKLRKSKGKVEAKPVVENTKIEGLSFRV